MGLETIEVFRWGSQANGRPWIRCAHCGSAINYAGQIVPIDDPHNGLTHECGYTCKCKKTAISVMGTTERSAAFVCRGNTSALPDTPKVPRGEGA